MIFYCTRSSMCTARKSFLTSLWCQNNYKIHHSILLIVRLQTQQKSAVIDDFGSLNRFFLRNECVPVLTDRRLFELAIKKETSSINRATWSNNSKHMQVTETSTVRQRQTIMTASQYFFSRDVNKQLFLLRTVTFLFQRWLKNMLVGLFTILQSKIIC